MPVKLGSQDVGKMYLGAVELPQAYLGVDPLLFTMPNSVFDAVGFDPVTYEMQGVLEGIGGLTTGRPGSINLEDYNGLYREFAAGEAGYAKGRVVSNLVAHGLNQFSKSGNVVVNGRQVTFTGNGTATTLASFRYADIADPSTPVDQVPVVCTIKVRRISGGTMLGFETYGRGTYIDPAPTYSGTYVNEHALDLTGDQWVYFSATLNPNAEGAGTFSVNFGIARLNHWGPYSDITVEVELISAEPLYGAALNTAFPPSEYVQNDIATHGSYDPVSKVYANLLGNTRDAAGMVTDGVGTALPEVPLLVIAPESTNLTWPSLPGTVVNLTKTPDAVASVAPWRKATHYAATLSDAAHRTNDFHVDAVAGTRYRLSFFAKAGGYNWVQLAGSSSVVGTTAWFNVNLTTGVIGNNGGGYSDAKVETLGNGWFRVSMLIEALFTTTDYGPLVSPLPSDLNSRLPTYIGNGTDGVYLDGMTCEVDILSPPIFTTGAPVTRPRDTYSFDESNHADDQGVYYMEYQNPAQSLYVPVISKSNGAGQGILMDLGYANELRSTGDASGVASSLTPYDSSSVHRIAVAYEDGVGKQCNSEGVYGTEVAYTAPWPDTFNALVLVPVVVDDMVYIRDIRRYNANFVEGKAIIDELMS